MIEYRDYERLEQKPIYWIQRSVNVAIKSKVIIDPDIGITIKSIEHISENKEHAEVKEGKELTCINGPLSPHETTPNYKKSFNMIIKMIETGYFSKELVDRRILKIKPEQWLISRIECGFEG